MIDFIIFFFKHKTAYEMRISDWSSDVCSSDLMELAILSVVRSNFGATEDQVALAAARRLGFKATSSQLKEVIAQVITDAVAKDLLARRNGLLVMGESAPGC